MLLSSKGRLSPPKQRKSRSARTCRVELCWRFVFALFVRQNFKLAQIGRSFLKRGARSANWLALKLELDELLIAIRSGAAPLGELIQGAQIAD